MKIFVVTGQTATGKTSLAIQLAQEHNGELINCDSRQIYKRLDIITGKDLTDKKFTPVEIFNGYDIGYYTLSSGQTKKKIWLYDLVDPKAVFSSFDYEHCALHLIQRLIDEKKTPVIVGGTYFYLYNLLYDIRTVDVAPDTQLRAELAKRDLAELQTILTELSPDVYSRLNPSEQNNPQRLIRKIEILRAGGDPGTGSLPEIKKDLSLSTKFTSQIEITGLRYDSQEKLGEAIEKRTLERLEKGAVEEVQSLLKDGYTKTDPGLQTIGYRQIFDYLEKRTDKDTMMRNWINKEKQYAKRQYTFMKRDPHIVWRNLY